MINQFDFTIPAALHSLYLFLIGYGLILLWAVALAALAGLAISAVIWLFWAIAALLIPSVESRWLAHMRQIEGQARRDAGLPDEPAVLSVPAPPVPPGDDDEDDDTRNRASVPLPAFRVAGFGRVAVLIAGAVGAGGIALAAYAGGPGWFALPSWLAQGPEARPEGGPNPPAGTAALPLAELLKQMPEGFRDSSHWMRDARSGCWIFHPSPVGAGESVTWSGDCAGGLAQGRGVAIWRENGKEAQRDEVALDHGLRDGVGILRFPSGKSYRDRYDHGRRVERQAITP
jgi:hypothetical protein